MRGRGSFWALFGIALLLLALSSLVETVEPEPAALLQEQPFFVQAAFLPYQPPHQEGAPPPIVLRALRSAEGLCLLLWLCVPFFAGCRDANGHWIRKKRYVDSVYQVFRQEVACG